MTAKILEFPSLNSHVISRMENLVALVAGEPDGECEKVTPTKRFVVTYSAYRNVWHVMDTKGWYDVAVFLPNKQQEAMDVCREFNSRKSCEAEVIQHAVSRPAYAEPCPNSGSYDPDRGGWYCEEHQ